MSGPRRMRVDIVNFIVDGYSEPRTKLGGSPQVRFLNLLCAALCVELRYQRDCLCVLISFNNFANLD